MKIIIISNILSLFLGGLIFWFNSSDKTSEQKECITPIKQVEKLTKKSSRMVASTVEAPKISNTEKVENIKLKNMLKIEFQDVNLGYYDQDINDTSDINLSHIYSSFFTSVFEILSRHYPESAVQRLENYFLYKRDYQVEIQNRQNTLNFERENFDLDLEAKYSIERRKLDVIKDDDLREELQENLMEKKELEEHQYFKEHYSKPLQRLELGYKTEIKKIFGEAFVEVKLLHIDTNNELEERYGQYRYKTNISSTSSEDETVEIHTGNSPLVSLEI